MAAQRILIDSSVIIDFFRRHDKEESVLYRLFIHGCELYISSLTYYELMCGAVSAPLQRDTSNVLSLFHVLDFGIREAVLAASYYQQLKKVNQLMDAVDILIAATATSYALQVASLNTAHFSRFQDIELFDVSE